MLCVLLCCGGRVHYVIVPVGQIVDADLMGKVRNLAFPAVLLSRGRVIPHEGCRYSIPVVAFTKGKINAGMLNKLRVFFC